MVKSRFLCPWRNKWCCNPSVCPMPLAQEWCISGLWLLWNTNRKPHAGSQTHWSPWPYGYLNWSPLKKHSACGFAIDIPPHRLYHIVLLHDIFARIPTVTYQVFQPIGTIYPLSSASWFPLSFPFLPHPCLLLSLNGMPSSSSSFEWLLGQLDS